MKEEEAEYVPEYWRACHSSHTLSVKAEAEEETSHIRNGAAKIRWGSSGEEEDHFLVQLCVEDGRGYSAGNGLQWRQHRDGNNEVWGFSDGFGRFGRLGWFGWESIWVKINLSENWFGSFGLSRVDEKWVFSGFIGCFWVCQRGGIVFVFRLVSKCQNNWWR